MGCEFLPFSIHWTDAILSLKLTGEDNPPVYYEEFFSGSFENYLFQMAFRMVEKTIFPQDITNPDKGKNKGNKIT